MYLRLKSYEPCANNHHTPALAGGGLTQDVRCALFKRHLSAFDWLRGGQNGPIKFIDLDQLEYSVWRARRGDLLASIMSKLYIDGLSNLIVPRLGAACQFSIGVTWNHENHFFTLAGQAIALRAIALCAPLRQELKLFEIGRAIHRFSTLKHRSIGLFNWKSRPATPSEQRLEPRIRDNAWYAMALHQFAKAYGDRCLQNDANLLSDVTIRHYEDVMSSGTNGDNALRFDDKLAAASLMAYRCAQTADDAAATMAICLLNECASKHAITDAGYAQNDQRIIGTDQAIDLDCTINLVRTCQNLARLRPQPTLASIAKHGTKALFNPKHALTRMPESGVLLAADTEKNASRDTNGKAPDSHEIALGL